jgi:phosphoribosylglycinamide formyltransferase-1
MVSGGGTNLQAVIDAVGNGGLPGASLVLVISSNASAFALERAARHGIPTLVAGRREFPGQEARTEAILGALAAAGTDLVVLAGYMSILPPEIIRAYDKRIINIHPSLIPRHCGLGCYGRRVHEAVLAAGDKESGATVHFVDEGVDTGPVIIQEKTAVLEGDDPDSLAARVLEVEHRILVRAVKMIMDGEY